MTPDGLEIARDHSPDEDRKQDDVEHNWELYREGRKEVIFDDDDLAEDRERERAREDETFYARYGF